ncbi:MAG TPA: peptide-methionine (R)-S-oxide reductase MsrB [Xanthobacteraceae bacterium]|nr:peptide-methionine (R)-S-oxide reductase MsrB [Xanthobacteraceae bacterium]
MITRRNALIGSAALAGVSYYAWASAPLAESKSHFEVMKSEDEWKRLLSREQYAVLRGRSTERPGSSPLDKEYRRGTFTCVACELPLFSSTTKFDSRTGWPSFWTPLDRAIETSEERGLLFIEGRTEVHCRRCGGHLGHVFEDGPPPTGLRYCINGVALKFRPA